PVRKRLAIHVPRDVGLPGRYRIPIVGVFTVLFQAFDFPGQVFVVPDPEPPATTMDETLVEGHRKPGMDAVKGIVQFPDIERFHPATVEHEVQAADLIRPSAGIGPFVDPVVEEQLQTETVSDGVRRGGFLHPMPQGQMDEFQRSVLALFPIGQRADLQPQELLAQLAPPGGPAVVDVRVFHSEEGRQFQRPAGRDQINGGKIPGGGYISVTPSRYGPRTREDASDRALDNCCACGHESCSLTSKTLGSLAKPCAIAVSSRKASAYGGSGISDGNSRSCCTLPFRADSAAEGIPEAIANRFRPLDGGGTDLRIGHGVDIGELFG